MEELRDRLDDVARSPLLLVATDFDGTLAPIVPDPDAAQADRAALVALRALSQTPQTHVAIVSGRALSDLATRTGDAAHLHLIGSHGSEFEAGLLAPLSPAAAERLERVRAAVAAIAGAAEGFLIETKPASIALHYRNAAASAAADALSAILAGPATWPGVHVRHGKRVVELSVIEADKGRALQRLRQRLGATGVVFIGDDATDEDAFATLGGPDVGVKVGPGETRARFRAADVQDVAAILARLAERRADWLAGTPTTPIDQHALLSDQRTVALVGPTGRVVWMCLPRIDSSAMFAELLGGPTAGYFDIAPVPAGPPPLQRYVGHTFVLETRWPAMTLTDYLDCGGGRAFQRAGRTDLIRVLRGAGRVRVTFAPRLDFGRMETRLRVAPAGVVVEGVIDGLVLRAPDLPWRVLDEGPRQTAVADVELSGEPLVLELRYGTANLDPDALPEPARRERTERFWSGWAATLQLPSVCPDLVRRSALVLKALCYGPTGAIAAAATTSLPEYAGGVRNWDYRFCWPRDAALAASALVRLGAVGPAIKFLDWVLGILDDIAPPALLCPVYTVTGAHLGPEAEIADLAGYRGSRPVRIGNAAARQVQLDVFGPIAELLALLAERGVPLSSEHWRMLTTMVGAVRQRWTEPDHGIWEVRLPPQHYVHSKVMCWQTVDRAVAVARYMGHSQPNWVELREEIAASIASEGWKPDVNAFGATYASTDPDAAVLAVGLSGLLAPDDPRFLGTLGYVESRLRSGPSVYRYRRDDGLPGSEGCFHLCTTWLIEALALTGRCGEAAALLQRYVALAGPTGLMSEEYDPLSRSALGNFPQAYSHLGLISAAIRVQRANAP